ncbi:peptide ABC transporter substrate-binding protein [Candidatus Kaiserbacteria bacterium]|nr:peptide ABC transporter substrate-binding protein [Candidatus Kaiserbacteria bacterium]
MDKFLNIIESASPSDNLILRLILFVVVFSGIWTALSINNEHSVLSPTYGGSFTEGIIGTPRYINPVLAITRADQDVVALIYSGLLKISPEGQLVNDVAEEINVSEDGLTYNIGLRRDVKFHDDTPLTARDVVYTIGLIQDPDLKSPLRGHWTDVTVEEINEYELNIILKEPYAPFIENFTVGILPAHAWSSLPIEQIPFSQLNTEPIGSGPFKITEARRSPAGLVTRYYLTAFPNHHINPKISEIILTFFEDEEDLIQAVTDEEVDATTYIPQAKLASLVSDKYQLIEKPLPRTFSVFYNQNRSPVLREDAVREALDVALDKNELINQAFHGFGVPIDTPTAFTQAELESDDNSEIINTSSTTIEQATSILIDAGWEQNELGFWQKELDDEEVTLSVTLRTSNAPLFESLSTLIAEQWKKLGVEVTTEQFEQTGLVQSVIRPRDFQLLLFGHDLSRSYDLYPIWHSSQQNDPGLNVAQYTNVEVDALLEKARAEQSEPDRLAALIEASTIISEEKPAIFIAQPTLTYLISKSITVTNMTNLGRSSDRFGNIADWHLETDSLWSIFRKDIE